MSEPGVERTVRIRDGRIPDSLLSSDPARIVWWGDSLSALGTPGVLGSGLAGVSVDNAGVWGDTAAMIAARQGAHPFRLLPVGGEIPASGSVDVTIASGGWPLVQGGFPAGPGPMVGTLAGVRGTLSITKQTPGSTAHEDGDVYTFTRSDSGEAVAATRPQPFATDFSESHRDSITIIWAGQNGGRDDPDSVVANVEAMVRHLSPVSPQYLILGVTTRASDNPESIAVVRDINSRLSAHGSRYVDVLGYLLAWGLLDAGGLLLGQDATDVAAGITPTSLRYDAVHLNESGRAIVANLVGQRLAELGWAAWAPQPVPKITQTLAEYAFTSTNLTGWTGTSGATIAHVADDGADTSGGCMECVYPASSTSGVRRSSIDIQPGTVVTVKAKTKRTVGTADLRANLLWRQADDGFLSRSEQVVTLTGGWDEVNLVGTAPPNAGKVMFEIIKIGTGADAPATIRVDDVLITASSAE